MSRCQTTLRSVAEGFCHHDPERDEFKDTPRRADSVSSLFHFFYSVLWHFGFTISEVLDIVLWFLQYERASWGDGNGLQTRRAPGSGIIKSTIGLDRQQPSMSRDTLKL